MGSCAPEIAEDLTYIQHMFWCYCCINGEGNWIDWMVNFIEIGPCAWQLDFVLIGQNTECQDKGYFLQNNWMEHRLTSFLYMSTSRKS